MEDRKEQRSIEMIGDEMIRHNDVMKSHVEIMRNRSQRGAGGAAGGA